MTPSTIVRVARAVRVAVVVAGVAGMAWSVTDLGAQTKIELEGVRNYTKVDTTIGCAGATAPEAMAELKEMGYASVINFRLPDERGATNEAGQAAADAAGMKYIHLPFTPTSDDGDTTVSQFLETLADEANLPAYIHCGSANRVGGMWMIKRVMVDGWDREKAQTEAELIGLRTEAVRTFVTTYLDTHAP